MYIFHEERDPHILATPLSNLKIVVTMNLLPAQSSIPNIPFHSKDTVHFVTRFPQTQKQSVVAKLSQ